MKNGLTKLLAAMLSCMALACAAHGQSSGDDQVLEMPRGPSVLKFKLDPEELSRYGQLALSGDENAGLCMAQHFMFIGFKDTVALQYWLAIAAENGNPLAMQMLSLHLASNRTEEGLVRSKFWKTRERETWRPDSIRECKRSPAPS